MTDAPDFYIRITAPTRPVGAVAPTDAYGVVMFAYKPPAADVWRKWAHSYVVPPDATVTQAFEAAKKAATSLEQSVREAFGHA